jgi:hypothetical protein
MMPRIARREGERNAVGKGLEDSGLCNTFEETLNRERVDVSIEEILRRHGATIRRAKLDDINHDPSSSSSASRDLVARHRDRSAGSG